MLRITGIVVSSFLLAVAIVVLPVRRDTLQGRSAGREGLRQSMVAGGRTGCCYESVPLIYLRPVCRMPFSMADAQVLSHEPPVAVGIVASIYLLGSMVQLMPVQMLGTGVTLSATFMLAVIFLVWICLDCPLPLLCRRPFGRR